MRKFFACILVLVLSSCTNSNSNTPPITPAVIVNDLGCAAESAVSSVITAAIVQQLSCTNSVAVQVDVAAIVAKSNICKPVVTPSATPVITPSATPVVAGHGKLSGPLGALACPIIIPSVMSSINAKIPQTWGCTGGAALPALEALLTAKCASVF